jgi:hypothetical protein
MVGGDVLAETLHEGQSYLTNGDLQTRLVMHQFRQNLAQFNRQLTSNALH